MFMAHLTFYAALNQMHIRTFHGTNVTYRRGHRSIHIKKVNIGLRKVSVYLGTFTL